MSPSTQTAQTPPKRRSDKGGSAAVAVVFAIVGFLLSSQLVSVRANTQTRAADTARLETLQELYNQELDRTERLEKQVDQMGEDLERYRQAAAENTSQGEALRAGLEKLGMTAGLVEVTGPGVTVILSDSAAVNTTGDEADYLIHDSDLLSVINELRSAGAEALSLNGERPSPPALSAVPERWSPSMAGSTPRPMSTSAPWWSLERECFKTLEKSAESS